MAADHLSPPVGGSDAEEYELIMRELYLGILKREPDPFYLRQRVEKLQRDGIRGGLSRAIDDLIQTDEFQRRGIGAAQPTRALTMAFGNAVTRVRAIHGWNGNHPSLTRLSETSGADKIIIDVGVWMGQSTITMANALRRAEIDGVVIAVDTFLGSIEHWDGALFDRIHGLPNLYQRFLDNVYHAGLT